MPVRRTRALPAQRRILFIILTVLMTLTCFLVAAEVMTRLLWPVREPTMHPWPVGYLVSDSAAGYALARNFPQTWMTQFDGKTRNLCYTNAAGMRDVPCPPLQEHVLRILTVGCSQTEGLGIQSPEQPWPRRLQEALNGAASAGDGTPAQVMNGGVTGYNCFQMVRHAEALQPLTQPRVWLMGYYQDMWGRNTYGLPGQFTMHWGTVFNREILEQFLGGRSAASRWLMDHSLFWRWAVLRTTRTDFGVHPVKRPYEDPAAATLQVLREFKTAAQERGVTPIVAYLPYLRDLDAPDAERSGQVNHRVAPICRELGLPFLDPTQALLAAGRKSRGEGSLYRLWAVAEQDPHYNPACNEAIARALAELLAPALKDVQSLK